MGLLVCFALKSRPLFNGETIDDNTPETEAFYLKDIDQTTSRESGWRQFSVLFLRFHRSKLAGESGNIFVGAPAYVPF